MLGCQPGRVDRLDLVCHCDMLGVRVDRVTTTQGGLALPRVGGMVDPTPWCVRVWGMFLPQGGSTPTPVGWVLPYTPRVGVTLHP